MNKVSKQRRRVFPVHLRHVYYLRRQAGEAQESLRESSREKDKGVAGRQRVSLVWTSKSWKVGGLEPVAWSELQG